MVSPYAHFIMIHATMRKLFEMYLRGRLPYQQQSDAAGAKSNPHFACQWHQAQRMNHCGIPSR